MNNIRFAIMSVRLYSHWLLQLPRKSPKIHSLGLYSYVDFVSIHIYPYETTSQVTVKAVIGTTPGAGILLVPLFLRDMPLL
jgi:hypothetical protein